MLARYKEPAALSRKGRGRVLDKDRVSDKVKDSGKVRRRVAPKASELKTSKIQSRRSSRSKSTPACAKEKPRNQTVTKLISANTMPLG